MFFKWKEFLGCSKLGNFLPDVGCSDVVFSGWEGIVVGVGGLVVAVGAEAAVGPDVKYKVKSKEPGIGF